MYSTTFMWGQCLKYIMNALIYIIQYYYIYMVIKISYPGWSKYYKPPGQAVDMPLGLSSVWGGGGGGNDFLME